LAEYLKSLERLRKIRRIARICPAHGDVIEDPHERLDEYMKHRRMRERQIVKVLGEGPTKISDIVARLYTETPEGLLDMAARQVYAHLLKLRSEGKVEGTGARSVWKLA
jgi:hydroxyacylglutathione hydrolase